MLNCEKRNNVTKCFYLILIIQVYYRIFETGNYYG